MFNLPAPLLLVVLVVVVPLTLQLTTAVTTLNITTIKIASMHMYTDTTKPIGNQTSHAGALVTQSGIAFAIHQFNNRDSSLVSEIASAEYMADCDVQLSPLFFDIGNTQEGAVGAYREAYVLAEDDVPCDVIIAEIYSSRTKTISFMGNLDKVVVTTGSATSDELDDVKKYPYFTRTVPGDSAVSLAAVKFLHDLKFTRVGVLYVNDEYGSAFMEGVVDAAKKMDVLPYTAPFDFNSGTGESVQNAIDLLIANSGNTINAFICVSFKDDFDAIIEKSMEKGLMGGSNVWVYTDGVSPVDFSDRGEGGRLFVSQEVVSALKGSFRIVAGMGRRTETGSSDFDRFEDAFESLDSDEGYQADLSAWAFKYTSDGGSGFSAGTDMSVYGPHFFANVAEVRNGVDAFYYDAAMQVGLGACKAIFDGFDPVEDGEALHAGMTNIRFDGWSGSVVFDEVGSRTPESTSFDIGHVVLDESRKLSLSTTATWDENSGFVFDCFGCVDIVFADGSFDAPKQKLVSANTKMSMKVVGMVLGAVAVVLLVVALFSFRSQIKMQKTVSQLKVKDAVLSIRVSNLNMEVHQLHESLVKSSHTAAELQIMQKAMDEITAERSNELRGVLIASKDVKLEGMLGKGGFGVVHLGLWGNQQVAVKQLMVIEADSVRRFRFECFLMKNLRHPNIVKLVGVCWDEMMLGCCLEYVKNGSLEDWLTKTRSYEEPQRRRRSILMGALDGLIKRSSTSDNKDETLLEALPPPIDFSWKGNLTRIACECALGVQYCHQSRYYDEDEKTWKECIVHRDLKPDNMLLTDNFTLKLTDFGEARATDLDLKMTTVGTPVYMAPEILRNDQYDSKVDVYSFAICLIAMMRPDTSLVKFFFESLRKSMKRKTMSGIGINALNNKLVRLNWRPLVPKPFRTSYPAFTKLIKECWSADPSKRPTFDDIVRRLQGEIHDEVNTYEEPDVGLLHMQEDKLYWDDMKDDTRIHKEEMDKEDLDWKELYLKEKADKLVLEKKLERIEEGGKEEE